MENILYLDDYINLYNKKLNKILIIKPYKETLRNGCIINAKKFIKKYSQILDKYHLNNNILNNSIVVITNLYVSEEDKIIIQSTLEELNYKKIKFISEINYLKVDKNTLIINYNNTYSYFYYTNYYGNIDINVFENTNIIKNNYLNLIKDVKKKDIFIFGKNYLELRNVLESNNINYYFYEDSNNLIIKLLMSSGEK